MPSLPQRSHYSQICTASLHCICALRNCIKAMKMERKRTVRVKWERRGERRGGEEIWQKQANALALHSPLYLSANPLLHILSKEKASPCACFRRILGGCSVPKSFISWKVWIYKIGQAALPLCGLSPASLQLQNSVMQSWSLWKEFHKTNQPRNWTRKCKRVREDEIAREVSKDVDAQKNCIKPIHCLKQNVSALHFHWRTKGGVRA